MPLTKTGKTALGGTGIIVGLALAGVVGYTTVQNSQELKNLANRPATVVTKTVVVTPTNEPTATPSATLKVPTKRSIATPKVTLKVTK